MIYILAGIATWTGLFLVFRKQQWGKGGITAPPSTAKAATYAGLFTALILASSYIKYRS